MDGDWRAMSGNDHTMLTEQERKAVVEAARYLYEALRPIEYLSPDSYRDLFKDNATKELFVTLANVLGHVRDTYAK